MSNLADEHFIEILAAEVELAQAERAPARLKAKVYSALVQRQTATGLLASLTKNKAQGHELCVFERLVQISPIGETMKSLNICRVCHARVLAEHSENPPIYWCGCPYVNFKKP